MADVIDLTSSSPVVRREAIPAFENGRSRPPRNSNGPATRPLARVVAGRAAARPRTRPAASPSTSLSSSPSTTESGTSSSGSADSSPGLFFTEDEEDSVDSESSSENVNYADFLNTSSDESESEDDDDVVLLPPVSRLAGSAILSAQSARTHTRNNPIINRSQQSRPPQTPTQQSSQSPSLTPAHKPSTGSLKRGRTESYSPEPEVKKAKIEAEVVDMTEIEDSDDEDIQRLVQEQRLKAQREEGAARRKISNITCSICLDHPDNVTATPCGHLYCNKCIKAALRFGQPNTKFGACPVCRRKVFIKDIVPLELKLITKVQGKGKGKA
ncbi:hypothetical protein ABW19_dt0204834 [Dactylella cylindrospora]|nr:hypothetical protein ABW19_dt0204834 [Dactylella cylindrospora]